MTAMNESLRPELLTLRANDESVRRELAADGSLFDGYHPRMEAVHRANAARLRVIMDTHGWPGRALVGDDGAEAAWRIAQHAIGEPAFMRACRDRLDEASFRGDAERQHFAFLDDRIRAFEGRPQRYGTQLRGGPNGLEPHPLEDESRVEERRVQVGLPALSEVLRKARAAPPPSSRNQAVTDQAELAWRRAVGWTA
ncbi:MAG: DUF6624 domain-containing protein [Acidobacteriota bacterium]